MFYKKILQNQPFTFNDFIQEIPFEQLMKGRKGSNSVEIKDDIPLMRTTTKYLNPPNSFTHIHYELIKKIKNQINYECDFNTCLNEIYNSEYMTMGYHSDQSLDLDENSFICIFSIYDDPTDIRTLKIKHKITSKCDDIRLENNSIVYFNYETNKQYLHKIILEENHFNNNWIGLTFRLSKTFIKFNNEIPYFKDTTIKLRFSNNDDEKNFYNLRAEENKKTDFIYPFLDFTINYSDLKKK